MMTVDMKRILYAAACLLGIFAVSSCKLDEPAQVNNNPIAFEGSMNKLVPALGAQLEYTWQSGDELGVFVYATTEMKYKVGTTDLNSELVALQADIPVSYGSDAYAVYPCTGANNWTEAVVKVPNVQTVKNGVNPYLFVLAAKAKIENEAAHFEFEQMNAVINLGLVSAEPIELGKLEITAVSPQRGNYLAGESRMDLSKPAIGDITKGQNTITVNFEEPLMVSTTPVYVPISVFPFATASGGLSIKVYEKRGYPAELEAIWTGSNEIADAGAVILQAGESATEVLPALSFEMFDMPGTAKITVKDSKTSSVRPGQEVSIYSLAAGVETFVQKCIADASGVISVELNAGEYVAYSAYAAGGAENANKVIFTVSSGVETSVEFVLNPIVFFEDFSWVNDTNFPGMLPLYGDIPGHVANTGNTPQYTTWTADQLALLSDRGWTATSFVYARPGALTLGKKNGVGTVTSPALAGLSSPNAEITLRVIPWHTVVGGVWKLEYSQITVELVGGGSFSETESVTSFTNKILTSGGDENPWLESVFTMNIYGATAATQLKISNGKPEESSSTMYRLMFSEIVVVEK